MTRLVLNRFPDNTIVRNGIGCYVADVFFSLARQSWVHDDLGGNCRCFDTRKKAELDTIPKDVKFKVINRIRRVACRTSRR